MKIADAAKATRYDTSTTSLIGRLKSNPNVMGDNVSQIIKAEIASSMPLAIFVFDVLIRSMSVSTVCDNLIKKVVPDVVLE
jgi:hypothetical protein